MPGPSSILRTRIQLIAVYEQVVAKDLSVRKVEELVRQATAKEDSPGRRILLHR